MASEKPVNVQDVFLNHVRKNKNSLTIFLINGVKLQGVVTWFDQATILLRREGHSQLVYKHAISTIMPQGFMGLFDQGNSNHENNQNHNHSSDDNDDSEEG
ncbi:MAG: RNA chaperone Hfq [Candidatus Puniceispirillum sp.]|nr:RNA chaperone Hfq [Candidatus Pelagibacter sp.]MBA4283060.1 RNA chaperone Hfq [Candidatus Puniceispirillum sp.]